MQCSEGAVKLAEVYLSKLLFYSRVSMVKARVTVTVIRVGTAVLNVCHMAPTLPSLLA